MKKQFLGLMLSAAACALTPAHAMDLDQRDQEKQGIQKLKIEVPSDGQSAIMATFRSLSFNDIQKCKDSDTWGFGGDISADETEETTAKRWITYLDKWKIYESKERERINKFQENFKNSFVKKFKQEQDTPIPYHSLQITDLKERGLCADAIYQIEGEKNGVPFIYIAKSFKSPIDFGDEKYCLERLKSFLKMECKGQIDFPRFVKYKGAFDADLPLNSIEYLKNKDMIVLTKAKGYSLCQSFQTYIAPGEINETSFLNHIKTVGKKIGNFHAHFGKLSQNNIRFESIVHGDLHMGNIFYDVPTQEVTLIDYASLSRFSRDCRVDLEKLFGQITTQTIEDMRYEASGKYRKFKKSLAHLAEEERKIALSQKQEQLESQNNYCYNRMDTFLLALKEGYLSAFTHNLTAMTLLSGIVDEYVKSERTPINWSKI